MLASLSARLRVSPYTVASIGLLLVVAYLCLVNLDYAALWHDEAPAAFFGKTLLQQGDIVGWDGRNPAVLLVVVGCAVIAAGF